MLLWSFVLWGMVFVVPVFAQTKFPFTARVKTDRVHVRAGQSNNYESLTTLSKDTELVVTGKNYSWYKVNLPEGSKMYLKMGYLKLLSTDVGEITADRVNIRARPNTDSAIIGQLVKGDQFFIRENSGEWLWIRPLAKAQGWVHEDLLEFKAQSVPAKYFQDPADAAARARIEKAAAERKRLAKFSRIKPVAEGQYEAEGVLIKVTDVKGVAYKIKVVSQEQGQADATAAYIDGPAAMLAPFTGTRVILRGTARDDGALDAAVLTVSRIKLAL